MKDESPALKKKVNEMTLVRVNVFYLIYISGGSVNYHGSLVVAHKHDLVFRFSPLRLQENQRLKQELLKSQTKVACLQSDMDSLKTELTDQSINSER